MKLRKGTHGNGVILAEPQSAAQSLIEALTDTGMGIMVQTSIREAGGTGLRCFVVGDRLLAAMERRGAKGDFRPSLRRGGHAVAVELTAQGQSAALRSTRPLGLHVAGADILRSGEGQGPCTPTPSPRFRRCVTRLSPRWHKTVIPAT